VWSEQVGRPVMHPLCRVRPTTDLVTSLAAVYYTKPGNSCGGYCHVVLDDENIADDHVAWCLAHCEEHDDGDGAALMRLFADMTRTQRLKVCRSFRDRLVLGCGGYRIKNPSP
jgi:hypothetical protein